MAKNKTSATGADVSHFIECLPSEERKQDAKSLMKILGKLSGLKPYMYGPTIVGYGNYHYQYDSGHSGDAPLIGFAPRKTEMVLYVEPEFDGRDEFLKKFGKYRSGKSCIYFKRLSDVDTDVLQDMVKASVAHTRNRWPE